MRLLRLGNMSIGGMAYFMYYVMKVERLLGPGIDNIIKHWNRSSCPHMKLIQASNVELDMKAPKKGKPKEAEDRKFTGDEGDNEGEGKILYF
jgi:hypothetical protein